MEEKGEKRRQEIEVKMCECMRIGLHCFGLQAADPFRYYEFCAAEIFSAIHRAESSSKSSAMQCNITQYQWRAKLCTRGESSAQVNAQRKKGARDGRAAENIRLP